ncbi:hypothetical protein BLNAU_24815 [Blattamonas nauphoetae]|uniref:Uncharacterized protein n=1 Tax=Blattamonas nauphoetae TaxID=2049346 RepID=A0ABQ9WLE7_9EUKA|nr:hypothetical protein BLNAU_24815 [Blattamonas nauphoetae]
MGHTSACSENPPIGHPHHLHRQLCFSQSPQRTTISTSIPLESLHLHFPLIPSCLLLSNGKINQFSCSRWHHLQCVLVLRITAHKSIRYNHSDTCLDQHIQRNHLDLHRDPTQRTLG